MKSYAVVDHVEGEFFCLEVELLEILESFPENFSQKDTVMMDVHKSMFDIFGEEINEQDVVIVEHDSENVLLVYQKDDEEKQRRIAVLEKILNT